jgi:hypothetical protein
MRQPQYMPRILFLSLTFLIVVGCAASFEPRSLEEVNFLQRAQTKSKGKIRVTAAVLSAEETEQVFGFPLYKKGIQPVWLQVENKDKEPAWFLPVGLDRDYFSPLEVTYPYHRAFQNEYNRQIDSYFLEQAMGLDIASGTTRSGFVFTNLELGTKIFNIDLVRQYSDSIIFTFFIEVPGLIADHRKVEFKKLYAADQLLTYDEADLKSALENIACCATDEVGTKSFAPLNIVMVGDGEDLLRVLVRSGWNETAASDPSGVQKELSSDIPRGYRYEPVRPLYYYGRRQDASLRGTRSTEIGQIVLRLWLSPMRVDGKPVWVGLVNRELTHQRRSYKNKILDLDEVRLFLLQNLWYAQGIAKFGYVKGTGVSSITEPKQFAGGIYYLTDGYRMVLWASQKSIPLDEVFAMDWDFPPER